MNVNAFAKMTRARVKTTRGTYIARGCTIHTAKTRALGIIAVSAQELLWTRVGSRARGADDAIKRRYILII